MMEELDKFLGTHRGLQFSLWSGRRYDKTQGRSIRVWEAKIFTERSRIVSTARSYDRNEAIAKAIKQAQQDRYLVKEGS